MNDYIVSSAELSDDELMHFKYLKRVRVNGKWRYYYEKINNYLLGGRKLKKKLIVLNILKQKLVIILRIKMHILLILHS